jgi:adenosylcobyric acid synthase
MVCGTASDAGKSHVVTGLCRLLARRGVKVAPFKAQNMALNSFVTASGHEIGRAQGVQALAGGVDPEVAMNPILLKPTGERTSQVVLMGRPLGHMSAAEYHELKPTLLATVLEALADLRSRFDVVIAEGAGSPAEINLLDHDIVNLRVASAAGLPAVVVGDIDRGGVFASLFGTVELLPAELRPLVRGFVINKFRGDPALLGDGLADLERRCGVPTLGVLPFVHDVALDAEDSLALDGLRPRPASAAGEARGDPLDVAAIRFPRLSNFTDLDALSLEPGVSVRLVSDAAGLGRPDLVVLPGTKATVSDLEWLRGRGLDRAVLDSGALVLGVCGGLQMMGRTIDDDVESGRGLVEGLGWLPVGTRFGVDKVTRQRRGTAMGQRVTGYQIHHGRVERVGPVEAAPGWVHLDDAYGVEEDGCVEPSEARFLGTTLHGLFESDGFRATFLTEVGRRADKAFVPAGVSFRAAREAQFDRLADLIEGHVDLAALEALIAEGAVAEGAVAERAAAEGAAR